MYVKSHPTALYSFCTAAVRTQPQKSFSSCDLNESQRSYISTLKILPTVKVHYCKNDWNVATINNGNIAEYNRSVVARKLI